MDVSFFMPEKYLPEPARREAWKSGGPVQLEQGGKAASVQCWIYQTWTRLSKAGFPAKLVHEMPDTGLVVALAGNLSPHFQPVMTRFLLGVVADGLPHPAADVQILQNAGHAKRLAGSVYMPHWTQPDLLPRDPSRGDRFEEIRFFGDEPNLCNDLQDPAFRADLQRELGLQLVTTPASAWHDYRTTDCSFAIRSFDGKRHDHKPASKLANAWLANVPFVGGSDSAYSSEGRDGINYLACRSRENFVEHLKRLKSDPAFRRDLVKAGSIEAARHTPEAHTNHWISLLSDEAPTRCNSWQKKSAGVRRMATLWRKVRLMIDRRLMN
jgi:hypothetical protein